MKQVLAAIALLFSVNAFAADVTDARLIDNDTLEVTVRYGGGCHEHTFALSVGACQETSPVRCKVTVNDVTAEPDFCEAIVGRDVQFKLSDFGLDDSYYSGARLHIVGGKDDKGVTIVLPRN